VTAYSVEQRTHEIGIRMALGAAPAGVVRMVLSQGLRLAAAGIGIGLFGSIFATRALSSLLYGVSGTDGPVMLGVAILLIGVVLLACTVPARRAVRVDPVEALRSE
jgi:putative ABC transport system permease protein